MTQPRLEFGVLGPVELRQDGVRVPIGGPKQRALLAYLVLNARSAVPMDVLVDALWDAPPKSSRKIVRIYVSRLQRLIDQDLSAERGAYRLQAEDEQIDLGRFERLVRESESGFRGGESVAAGRRLRAALALWRGPALAGLDDEPFVAVERARIEELRVGALERRIDADLAAGEFAVLVPELETLVARHPLREHFRAQLMLALYRAGRQAEALECYQAAREILVEELGIEPGKELKRLQRAILVQDPDLDVPPSEGQRPTRLPAPPTPLIGRETELAEARALLARSSSRLLTVTGAPGTGKTRLALELAATVAPEFADGALFIDLSSLADPDLVPSALAQSLAVPERGGSALEGVKRFVGERELLLVLDNFEHLLPAAPALSELLAAAPGLKLLVTSRAALRLTGEQEYRLEPLELTGAVDLFVDRARSVKPGFELTDENRDAVADICSRVDGLPLALELAAARVRLLGVEELAERLAHPLSLLRGGARDLPDRQRTLRATIEWSYGLLAPEEQVLLARLSVFAGSFDLTAAEEVCGPALDADLFGGLEALVASSLVREVSGRRDRPRFALLATIREHAAERLAERPDAGLLQRRHAEYMARLADRALEEMQGRGQEAAFAAVDEDYENFRAALAWAIACGDAELALVLVTRLGRYWTVRGLFAEGVAWHLAALRLEGQAPRLRARALRRLGILKRRQGLRHESLALIEESLALFRSLGDAIGTGNALLALGSGFSNDGRLAEAEECFVQSRDLFAASGEVEGLADSIGNLGYVALLRGEPEEARRLCLESARMERERGDLHDVSVDLGNVGLADLLDGRLESALAHLAEAVRAARPVGYSGELVNALLAIATVAERRGDLGVAAALFAAGETALRDRGIEVEDPFERELFQRTRVALAGRLDPADALELDAAVARALAYCDGHAHKTP